MNAIKDFENISSIGEKRFLTLYHLLGITCYTEGDVAEVGVYKGGSAKMLAKTILPFNKTVHLFDTFCGMPEVNATKDNHHKKGDFAGTSLDAVQKYLADCLNVIIHPGFFPDTAQELSNRAFSFVHIDVDIYQSTLDCCKFFYSKMSHNGIMVCDDYGCDSCLGAKLAMDEFFKDKYEPLIVLNTGQCFIRKDNS